MFSIFFGNRKKLNPLPAQKQVEEAGPYGKAPGKYRNIFLKQVKPSPNPALKYEISQLKHIVNQENAFTRISSLSNYLIKMVGFITPAGHHWFPGALENIIYASQGTKMPPAKMQAPAKEFWQLMAMADNYWTSDHFISYLESMDKTPSRDVTITVIKEIKDQKESYSKVAFSGRNKSRNCTIHTDLKQVKELMVCAYSGELLSSDSESDKPRATAEHIYPQSLGGKDNDFNFLMTSSKANNERRNLTLLKY
ncbi:MAG: hypothetical protein AB1782_11265, partial [Cyanobacteriota bacterium]